jgi:hypothetical protein
MATLVLTTVGGLVGGPLGAALGATLGRAVDGAVLFKPRGRQGPRLADLAVQTSSYGRSIPRIYGRMRVAGQVIWSTDLIEHRGERGGGKGQPSVTSYSYSVSFAVAISSRQVRRIGRIWADGNLLRGAADDWKVKTGFRLHDGDEAQEADPLIASAEGIGRAPAHRGLAYVVFEDLPLEAFGNRIPSLTFEVVADEEDVPVGRIAQDLGGGTIVTAEAAMPLAGFAADGDSVRDVVEALAAMSGAWFGPVAGGVTMRAGDSPDRVITDEGPMRRIAAADQAPATVCVAHYDPERDWQIGVQSAARPERSGSVQQVEIAAALPAAAARGAAERMLARVESERRTRRVTGDLTMIEVLPGEVVTIAGEGGGRWRLRGTTLERHQVALDLVALAPAALPALAASPGRVLRAPDNPIGATILHAAELPPMGEFVLGAPSVTIVAAGTGAGWRRAALQYSVDDGASWSPAGGTAAAGIVGSVIAAVPAGPATIADRVAVIRVKLAHGAMVLGDADAAALDRGANLALVGDELVQFGRARMIGAGAWELSDLWRGRRGTVPAPTAVDARFVLIEQAAARLLAVHAAPGGRVLLYASGAGDMVPASAEVVLSGASILPPAPVRLRAAAVAEGTMLQWRRRSRTDWRWSDGVDAALGEEAEAYLVKVTQAGGETATFETSTPSLLLDAQYVSAGTTVSVRQRGTHGVSAAAEIILQEGLVP